MNAFGFYEELTGEAVTLNTRPATEEDKARQWLNGIDFDTMPANEGIKAEFFHYEVSVFHAKTETYDRFYLSVMSPQKKAMGRRSFPDTYARGDASAIKAGFDRFLSQMEEKRARHTARVNAKRQARADFVNPYKAGNFLYSSWGYEQTNREFYQILEVRDLALKIREVSQNRTRDSHDTGHCSPIRDKFIKPAHWVTIQVDTRGNHSVPSPIHGNLYAYEGQPVYFSDGY